LTPHWGDTRQIEDDPEERFEQAHADSARSSSPHDHAGVEDAVRHHAEVCGVDGHRWQLRAD